MMPASLMRTLFASGGKLRINASRSDLPGPATRPGHAPGPRTSESSRPDGRRLLEGGRRLEQGKRNVLGARAPLHDLDHAAPHDEERGAGPAFLADVLAVTVLALVDDTGSTREIPASEVLEETDLPEEFDEAPASLRHGAFRRLEQRPRPERRDVRRARCGRRGSSRAFRPGNVGFMLGGT